MSISITNPATSTCPNATGFINVTAPRTSVRFASIEPIVSPIASSIFFFLTAARAMLSYGIVVPMESIVAPITDSATPMP